MRLLASWIDELSLQQQAVLVMALRGPDGFHKHHGSKRLLRYYRACIMVSAMRGKLLEPGESAGTFMLVPDDEEFAQALQVWTHVEDAMPVHYYTHFMHGAQVLAYKHPDEKTRKRWWTFYDMCCDYLHVPHETEAAMDERLNDFGTFGKWTSQVA